MAVPIPGTREDFSETQLQLYFPVLTTSPAIPQSGSSYLSDIQLQNISIKNIYLERGDMAPNPGWDGAKYPWASTITEIQSDFINVGDYNTGNFNLLKNTALTTKQKTYWEVVAETPSDNPRDWVYSKEAPSDLTKIWVNTTNEKEFVPKYWVQTEQKWENLYDLRLSTIKGTVSIIDQKTGNSFQIIRKVSEPNRIGIAQFAELPTPLLTNSYLTVSLDLEETTNSGGVYFRIEFFDRDRRFISSMDSPRFFNRTNSKKRFSHSFLYRNTNFIDAYYFRISFLGVPERQIYAAFNKTKVELGNTDTGWNLHEEEVVLDLNAGEIDMPMIDGLPDKSQIISEIAVLKSVLGEGLLKWEEITRIKASTMQEAVLYDYFVENGNYYRYALQPILANGVKGAITTFYDSVSTFEGFWLLGEKDMQFSFIYDGKIGTMTKHKPEDFIETISGRFPYAVRSSELDYFTFPFSGKLTYHQDVHNLLTAKDYTTAISPDPSIPINYVELKYGDEMRLNAKNDLEEMQDGMVMQRAWRNKILKWLTDGGLKVLKSESQGNILVKISDVKVTPVESLYGLIADFECTMTQMGVVDEKTLQRYKLRKAELTKEDLLREAMKADSL